MIVSSLMSFEATIVNFLIHAWEGSLNEHYLNKEDLQLGNILEFAPDFLRKIGKVTAVDSTSKRFVAEILERESDGDEVDESASKNIVRIDQGQICRREGSSVCHKSSQFTVTHFGTAHTEVYLEIFTH